MFHSISSSVMFIASGIFILGLVGSTVVVLISFVEDFGELFSKDEQSEMAHSRPPAS